VGQSAVCAQSSVELSGRGVLMFHSTVHLTMSPRHDDYMYRCNLDREHFEYFYAVDEHLPYWLQLVSTFASEREDLDGVNSKDLGILFNQRM
jgi:hypothetical protein